MTSETGSASLQALAREHLGYEHLRPGQFEAASTAADGRDVLCVMATGSGKTAVYQLAALARGGITVVVSPLIALQRDQLESRGMTGAALLNSTLGAAERRELLEGIGAGEVPLVLLAPEQLADERVLELFAASDVRLLVVDEAHCVSEWGHDFRPDYLRLAHVAEALGRPPILALTATATPQVRQEIAEVLALEDPLVVVKGFDRPNIHLSVRTFHDAAQKQKAVIAYAAEAAGPGIVYCATKNTTTEVARALKRLGVRAAAYHGGLRSRTRDDRQAAFMDPAGDVDVIVATIAFGMGVDKGDVRWIAHHDVSASPDAYWQEIGRAGRDGEPAQAALFFRGEDLGLRRFFAAGEVDEAELEQVAETIADADEPLEPSLLADELELSATKLATSLRHFERAGFAELTDDGRIRQAKAAPAIGEAVAAGRNGELRRLAFDRSRVELMRNYADSRSCRRAFLLEYLGEPFDAPCGHCDICDTAGTEPAVAVQATDGEDALAAGDRVLHSAWGEGTVGQTDADKLTVAFDTVGYRTLARDVLAKDLDLLRRLTP